MQYKNNQSIPITPNSKIINKDVIIKNTNLSNTADAKNLSNFLNVDKKSFVEKLRENKKEIINDARMRTLIKDEDEDFENVIYSNNIPKKEDSYEPNLIIQHRNKNLFEKIEEQSNKNEVLTSLE